ncbi:pentapeptide repeat-containing protein [Streptomyces sp. NPDC001165]|uniref:pentapeptide repeat-containing protein n=1 Tax=Streptomyces sp. NPDC001165 TaxID=3364546 RepID=UPI0036797099
MSTPLPPSWPYCGHGANPATDPVGCPGIHVPGHTACLAHLADTDRTAYLTGLVPGADIDHRGTPFTQDLLQALLQALTDPSTGKPHVGDTWFDRAHFSGEAWFFRAQFSGEVRFGEAQFSDKVLFNHAQFSGDARFDQAQFSGEASFHGAQFSGEARFDQVQFSGETSFFTAQFSGEARFDQVQFSGKVSFGGAQFSSAHFSGARFSRDARFECAQFSSDALFDQVQFSGKVSFNRAQFSGTDRLNGNAWFNDAQFSGEAEFDKARFSSLAYFGGAHFSRDARFESAQFSANAFFHGAQFSGEVRFGGAQFSADARFDDARFEGVSLLGPLLCGGAVVFSGAAFALPVTLEIAAAGVVCNRTRWESTVAVRVRYAAVDLGHALLTAPAAVIAHPTPFTHGRDTMREDLLAGPRAHPRPGGWVRIVSVQGVDAAHLVLTDTDLSYCLFSGAFHLDQIRLEGRTTFASVPTGWHRRGIRPVHWTRRRTLAEEHHWRAHTAHQPAPAAGTPPEPRLWRPGPHHPDPARTPDPEDVVGLYRQLRKAFEDGKNEPGAADFYYGECEMRRHDPDAPWAERRLLWAYWLLSGYGLRASRAFGWLLAAMSLTILLLMSFGLPTHDPDPATTGTLHGSKINLNTRTPDPALHGPWAQRRTWARAEKATRVAVNSVVFRSSGQNLTTAGTYIEMSSRLFEPTLLALAALAVRGRIKR